MGSDQSNDVVFLELPAPPAWKKLLVLKRGGGLSKNEIKFIAPSGEEIKTRRQLEVYLKLHPGNPKASEFDWGTGETPRRSERISIKLKSTPPPFDIEPLKKRGRQSSSTKNDNKEMEAITGGTEGPNGVQQNAEIFRKEESKQMQAPSETNVDVKEVEMKDAEGIENGHKAIEARAQETEGIKDVEMIDAEAIEKGNIENEKNEVVEEAPNENKTYEKSDEGNSQKVEVGKTDSKTEAGVEHKPNDETGGIQVNLDKVENVGINEVKGKVEKLLAEISSIEREKPQTNQADAASDEKEKSQTDIESKEKVKCQSKATNDEKENGKGRITGSDGGVLNGMGSLLKEVQDNNGKSKVEVEVVVKKVNGEGDGK